MQLISGKVSFILDGELRKDIVCADIYYCKDKNYFGISLYLTEARQRSSEIHAILLRIEEDMQFICTLEK